jgi:alkylation response protein AidB-like acyl-CoA dehydrogenase
VQPGHPADAPKHRGISWLILPMDAPGVEIRPLRSVMDTDEFSELIPSGTPDDRNT